MQMRSEKIPIPRRCLMALSSAATPTQETKLAKVQDIDAIEEMRMRTWARQNYVPATDRDVNDLHPVVLDEMVRKDHEFRYLTSTRRFLSLAPTPCGPALSRRIVNTAE